MDLVAAQVPAELVPDGGSLHSVPLYLPSATSNTPLLLKSINCSSTPLVPIPSRTPFSLLSRNASAISVETPLASTSSLGERSAKPSPSTSEKLSSPTAYANTVILPLRGRNAALVMVALQEPETVLQEGPICPPSAMKLTVVPSGTGLLKWSDKRAVNTVISPSKFNPSMFRVVALIEKLS